MLPLELRSLAGLASLYAFRMLGLFMVLPVLAIYAGDYKGATPLLIGLALGVYGLSQSVLQIPFGILSDRIGRKPVILFGMVLFLIGSLVAALSESMTGIVIGRTLQGAGAVASTIMALLSDLTREEVRVRAMASVGATIGLSFAGAMVLGPWIASQWGLDAIFLFTALLSVFGILVVIFVVPSPQHSRQVSSAESLARPSLMGETLKNGELARLNFGIFTLHLIQMACWVSVPQLLESAFGLDRSEHWWFYITVMGAGFAAMVPLIIVAEKHHKMKPVFVAGVAILMIAELALAGSSKFPLFVGGLLLFFTAFNLLEACLPSLVSKSAPSGSRGTAMGVYSSSQFFGAFAGGLAGGWLVMAYGPSSVFVFSALMAAIWLLVAAFMPVPRRWSSKVVELAEGELLDRDGLLANVPGLADIVEVPEHGLAYLKIDKSEFDADALERFRTQSRKRNQ